MPLFFFTRNILCELGLVDEKAPEGRIVRFQVYSRVHCDWRQVKEGHCVSVKPSDCLLVAVAQLEPNDLVDLANKLLLVKAHDNAVNIRTNLAGKCASVRVQAKAQIIQTANILRETLSSPLLPSSSPLPSPPQSRLCQATHEDVCKYDPDSNSEDILVRKRKRSVSATTVNLCEDSPLVQPISRHSSPIFISSSSPEPVPAVSKLGDIYCDTSDTLEDSNASWPDGVYVCQLRACFDHINLELNGQKRLKNGWLEQIFAAHFENTKYVKSTFYKIKACYEQFSNTHKHELDSAISAGHATRALWKNFKCSIGGVSKSEEVHNAQKVAKRYLGTVYVF
jgi:hypothetical protein